MPKNVRHPSLRKQSKVFIVDTCALQHDPRCVEYLAKDETNLAVIPLYVIQELDRQKTEPGAKGANARAVIRKLDEWRKMGDLTAGVQLGNGRGFVAVDQDGQGARELWPDLADNHDNRCLVIAKKRKDRNPRSSVTIITKDGALRVIASAVKIAAEDYETDKAIAKASDLYSGWAEFEVKDPKGLQAITDAFRTGKIPVEAFDEAIDLACLFPNQCCKVLFGSKYLLAIFKKQEGYFLHVPKPKRQDHPLEKIQPINDGQACLYYLLKDESVRLITVAGTAGTGKSLIVLQAAYEQVGKLYEAITVYRPIIEVGQRSLGFLPGDFQEKMEPWQVPVFDNLRYIFGSEIEGRGNAIVAIKDMMAREELAIEPPAHTRGRNIHKEFIVIDEAQNLTPVEVKTLLTRGAESAKTVIIGDIEQIDNPYLDATSNGLPGVVETFKNEEVAGHVTLTECERGRVAALAAKLL